MYGDSSVGMEIGLHEGSTLEPTNPYSAAKAGAEMLVKAYVNSYKLPCITTRGNNVYGPHQFPEKMIPKFILRASRGEDLPVHGDGLAVRSYLHVDDVAAAFDVVLHKVSGRKRGEVISTPCYTDQTQIIEHINRVVLLPLSLSRQGVIGEVYNIGTTKERSVLEVARDICCHFNLPESKIVHVADRAFNDQRYFINDTKLAVLGWKEVRRLH